MKKDFETGRKQTNGETEEPRNKIVISAVGDPQSFTAIRTCSIQLPVNISPEKLCGFSPGKAGFRRSFIGNFFLSCFEIINKCITLCNTHLTIEESIMRSVRLNKELEKKIDSIAKQKEISRSEVIREALKEYVVNHQISTRPYEIGKTWFGARGSGESDRSVTYKSRIKSRLREKRTR